MRGLQQMSDPVMANEDAEQIATEFELHEPLVLPRTGMERQKRLCYQVDIRCCCQRALIKCWFGRFRSCWFWWHPF